MKIINFVLPEQNDQSDFSYFYQFTKKLDKISCVVFALYAAKLVNFDQKAINCLNLVEKWLKNPESVTRIELRNACWATTNGVPVNAAAFTIINSLSGGCAARAVAWTITVDASTKNKLLNYLGYLLPKEPELNNFNIELLKQNPQAYSFLENISELEDYKVTNEDLFGIRQIFDVLEEVGAPLDLNEFIWDGETTEKHKLLQSIRREFT